jgi:hypothetical protein
MARTVGDTQLPTNVPPVNAPNGRRLSVTLPRCAAAFAIAPPPAGRHGGGCPSTKPRPFALPLGRFLRPMSDVTLPMRSCLRHRSPMRSKARPGNARERRDDAFNVIRHVGLPALPYLPSFTETRSGRQDDTIEGDGPRRSSVDATRAPNSSRFYSVRFRSGSRTGCAFPRQGGSAAKELPL